MDFNSTPFSIEKLKLVNFRCFESLEVDFHPQLTVLVAENGGGKTSVLEGLSIALGELVNDLTSVDQRLSSGVGFKDKDFRLRLEAGRNGRDASVPADFVQAIVTCRLDKEAFRWDAWKQRRSETKPAGIVGTKDLKKLVQNIFARADSGFVKTPGLAGLLGSFLPALAYYGFNKSEFKLPQRIHGGKHNYGAALSTFIGCLRSGGDMKEFLTWFDEAETAELRMNKGVTDPESREILPALDAVRSALETVLSSSERRFANPRFEENPKRFCLDELLPDDHHLTLNISQLSDGYARVLTIVMDYARRLGLANQHTDMAPLLCPGVVLIDEIDIHLHPRWQQRVISDLLRTFPYTQFIVTTHSPQVLSTVPSDCIRILRDGKIFAATAGTEGAEAQRILEDVFLVSPRPKTQMSDYLDEYLRLVDAHQWESARALQLRQELDQWSQGNEPRLTEADLQISNMKWEAGQ